MSNAVPVPHRREWVQDFQRESEIVRMALGPEAVALHHIGSTAIADIFAKPIIDILVEATSLEKIDARSHALQAAGYEAKGEYGISGRRYFRKSDDAGRRTHHLHVFVGGSDETQRHLAFRDYLRTHSERAADYSALKIRIVEEWRGTDEYIARKDGLVKAIEGEALVWMRHRARHDPSG